MARESIVLKGNGHQIEPHLAAGQTPKPGQCISLKSDGEYEAWNGAANGERDEIILLREDTRVGKTKEDAYAADQKALAYIPQPGDEVQVLVKSGQTVAIGSKLILEDGSGKFLTTTGTPESEPFKALEASGGALGADTLILARKL